MIPTSGMTLHGKDERDEVEAKDRSSSLGWDDEIEVGNCTASVQNHSESAQ